MDGTQKRPDSIWGRAVEAEGEGDPRKALDKNPWYSPGASFEENLASCQKYRAEHGRYRDVPGAFQKWIDDPKVETIL